MDDVETIKKFIRDIRDLSSKRNLGLDTACARTLEAVYRLHPPEHALPISPREPWESAFPGTWRVLVPGGWLYWQGKANGPMTFVPDGEAPGADVHLVGGSRVAEPQPKCQRCGWGLTEGGYTLCMACAKEKAIG